jgi:hypothetical protein
LEEDRRGGLERYLRIGTNGPGSQNRKEWRIIPSHGSCDEKGKWRENRFSTEFMSSVVLGILNFEGLGEIKVKKLSSITINFF